ncbi:UNVERIFIED_CONTAM: hypothetical protein HDU68_002288, partial [Siphonaria sp. JEL0065]
MYKTPTQLLFEDFLTGRIWTGLIHCLKSKSMIRGLKLIDFNTEKPLNVYLSDTFMKRMGKAGLRRAKLLIKK